MIIFHTDAIISNKEELEDIIKFVKENSKIEEFNFYVKFFRANFFNYHFRINSPQSLESFSNLSNKILQHSEFFIQLKKLIRDGINRGVVNYELVREFNPNLIWKYLDYINRNSIFDNNQEQFQNYFLNKEFKSFSYQDEFFKIDFDEISTNGDLTLVTPICYLKFLYFKKNTFLIQIANILRFDLVEAIHHANFSGYLIEESFW